MEEIEVWANAFDVWVNEHLPTSSYKGLISTFLKELVNATDNESSAINTLDTLIYSLCLFKRIFDKSGISLHASLILPMLTLSVSTSDKLLNDNSRGIASWARMTEQPKLHLDELKFMEYLSYDFNICDYTIQEMRLTLSLAYANAVFKNSPHILHTIETAVVSHLCKVVTDSTCIS